MIEDMIQDLGRATLIAGYMIDLNYFSVRLHIGIGHFSLTEISACNAVQDSLGEPLPILTFSP